MKTRAAILTRLKRPLQIVELEIPQLKAHQVLVRVRVTGVCGSQLGEMDGLKGPDRFLPHCLGHEAGAVVEAVGPGVRKTKRGDHVVLHWRPGTGTDAEPARYDWNGRVVNAGRVTTFQEHAVISENRLTVIPKSVPFETAALYGCAVTTGFGIVANDAALKKGETVLVLGSGGIGQVQILAARDAGASVIIATDLYEKKLTLARKNGATHTLRSGPGLSRQLQKILGRRPLDVVLENTGKKSVIEFAYESAGPQGRVILVGVPDARQKAEIDTLPLHFGKILTGSHGGGARPDRDIPRILAVQRRKRWDLRPMSNPGYTLDTINDALNDLRSGKALRPLVTP